MTRLSQEFIKWVSSVIQTLRNERSLKQMVHLPRELVERWSILWWVSCVAAILTKFSMTFFENNFWRHLPTWTRHSIRVHPFSCLSKSSFAIWPNSVQAPPPLVQDLQIVDVNRIEQIYPFVFIHWVPFMKNETMPKQWICFQWLSFTMPATIFS